MNEDCKTVVEEFMNGHLIIADNGECFVGTNGERDLEVLIVL